MRRGVIAVVLLVVLVAAAWVLWSPGERPESAVLAATPGAATTLVFEQHGRTGEYVGDIDVAAVHVSADGALLWNEGKQAATVSSGDYQERNPVSVSDGEGGILVFFEAEARTGKLAGDTQIMGQRLDSQGKMMWNGGERSTPVAYSDWGEKHPVAVSDGQGGAIVIFEQYARGGEYAGDIDLGAQRVSREGKLLWGKGGESSMTVSSGKYLERNAAAIPDGAGGAIVVFESEARSGENAGDVQIFAQRLNSEGKMMWNDGERSTGVAYSAWGEKNPVLVPDGEGGAFVIHEQYGPAGENAGDIDVAAQRISRDGRLLWNEGKRSVDVASSHSLERAPAAVSDGAGGIIVFFELEARTGKTAGDSEIFAQRLSADGRRLWKKGEESVAVAASKWGEKRPVAIADGRGGAIVAFEEHGPAGENAGDTDVGAQRLSSDGTMMWNQGEKSAIVASSAALERVPTMVSDGAGGVVVFFELENRTGENVGDSEIFGQRLAPDGTMLWNKGERSSPVATSRWGEKGPVAVR